MARARGVAAANERGKPHASALQDPIPALPLSLSQPYLLSTLPFSPTAALSHPTSQKGGKNDLPPCRRLEGLLLPSLPYCLCFAAEISVGRGEGGLRAALPLVSLYLIDATQPLPLLVVLSIPGTYGDELFPGSSPIRTGK